MGGLRHTTLGNVIVDKVIKEYPNGVYEARVLISYCPEVLEKKGNKGVSTMFPRTWTEDRLKVELEHALRNGNKVEGFERKWKGTTKSGVEIEWIFDKSGNISTIYPIK
ncbi:EndoU domain-containing protein [Pasteurella multocida]|uniref:EndoU domain-containing protein n=1 Tax=Pasteurella multocida TaxID=747 RepID=UPI0007EE06EF|nr:EndoU domain-containing protein [Pasteurella multocida]OBP32431.1 hypothetical protein A0R69_10720 [Pasteurella multocida subsp. multocida]